MTDGVLLESVHLKKSFDDLEVLRDINVKVQSGEVVCIIGPSGSGKSTFLRCINQLETPTGGQVLYKGQDMCEKGADIRAFREKVGMVFQRFNLFPMKTVLANVTMAPVLTKHKSKEEAEELGMELLRKVGLESKAKAKPAMLSGGQQQRVSIARAIVKNPKIIFADEPTAALDYQTSIEVLQVFEQIVQSRGSTVVMITHNPEIARMANRVVKLRNGVISSIRVNLHPAMATELVW